MEGEKLYVPEEPEPISGDEPAINQEPTVETEMLLEEDTQPIPVTDVIEGDAVVNDVPINEIEQQTSSEALPTIAPDEPTIEDEALKKVEEIVDDTKLLDNVNGQ